MDITLYLLQIIIVLASMAAGYVVGLLQGGINIYRDKKPDNNKPQEYNNSYLNEIPDNMKLFVEQNKGQYK